MLRRIAQKLLPNRMYFDRVRIEYGEILSQRDCESILFFMHPNLEWGGALNKAVLAEAGQELDEHILSNVENPRSGDVYMLPPFKTQYKALFMAVLADWDGGNGFEERDLLDCYRKAVAMAQMEKIRNIAVPAMGRDKRDFPHIRFARLALKGILERLDTRLDFVKVMCIDRTMMSTYLGQMEKLKSKAA